jgi:hypothetical protein
MAECGKVTDSDSKPEEKKEGKYTYWYSNGDKNSECNYVNGELDDGKYTYWYSNGKKEGRYRKYKNNRLIMYDYNINGRKLIDILNNRRKWMLILVGITRMQKKWRMKTIERIKQTIEITEIGLIKLIRDYMS